MLFGSRFNRWPNIGDKMLSLHKKHIPVNIRLSYCGDSVWVDVNNVEITEIGHDFLLLDNLMVKRNDIVAISEMLQMWVWDEDFSTTDSTYRHYPRQFTDVLREYQDSKTRIYLALNLGIFEQYNGEISEIGTDFVTMKMDNDCRITVRVKNILYLGEADSVDHLKEIGSLQIYNAVEEDTKIDSFNHSRVVEFNDVTDDIIEDM